VAIQVDCGFRYDSGFELHAEFGVPGGVTALCGPSGSGKTTILMLVAGLLRPRQGRIAVDGRIVADAGAGVWVPPHERAVGFVFQDSLLFPHRDVRANLVYGRSRRPARELDFDHVVEVLEIGELLDRAPATLSGGQARRVAIGRALLRGPRLLLLDEPWVGLDEQVQGRVASLVQRCIEEWAIPTLLVSHDPRFVEALADRILQVDGGRVREPE
jgi:molybdate transport system ATP-binding protein